jgi:RHS repeat-associated protein
MYDADGNRVREVMGDKVVYSVYLNGMLLSQETQKTQAVGGTDSIKKDLVYFNGAAVAEVTYPVSGGVQVQHQLRDRLGNPVVLLSSADGYVPRFREYSPYGAQMRVEASRGEEPTLQFTGHQRDQETGLDYMKNRTYSPTIGIFLTPDPARDFDWTNGTTFNLYQYARSNPVNFVDPDGTTAQSSLGLELASRMLQDAKVSAQEKSDPKYGCTTRAEWIFNQLGYKGNALKSSSTGYAMFAALMGSEMFDKSYNGLRGAQAYTGAIRFGVSGTSAGDRGIREGVRSAWREFVGTLQEGDILHFSMEYKKTGHTGFGVFQDGAIFEVRGGYGIPKVKLHDVEGFITGRDIHMTYAKIGRFQGGGIAALSPAGVPLERSR